MLNTNLKRIAGLYIKALKVKVTAKDMEEALERNPFYPSLLSLSESFEEFKISNKAYKIESNSLPLVPTPFIAYVKFLDKGSDFVLVKKITDQKVDYYYDTRQSKSDPKEEFLKRFDNIVFIASPTAESGEGDFRRKVMIDRRRVAINFVLSAMVILACIFNNRNAGSTLTKVFLIESVVKLIGLSLSISLLIYEMNGQHSSFKGICGVSKSFGCNRILRSRGAKIGPIKWSEIGLYYFSATTLCFFNTSIAPLTRLGTIAILNGFAILFVPYSIYFQWRVARTWCPFCLLIQTVLTIEFIWSFAFFWQNPFLPQLTVSYWIQLLFCVTLPMLIWRSLKQILILWTEYLPLKSAFARIKNNPVVISAILNQQPTAPDGYHKFGINLGNAAAENLIIMVCSPFCSYCGRMHLNVERLLDANPNLKLKIIFTGGMKIGGNIIQYLLSVANRRNEMETRIAINKWYATRSMDLSLISDNEKQVSLSSDLDGYDEQIISMEEWCKKANITYTPTLFINGHLLHEDYDLSDFRMAFKN
jgi:uncharacterized membrane protein